MSLDSKLDLDDVSAGHPVAMRELAELRGALDRDKTGLAAALNAIRKEIDARHWITEGRGSYEWDDAKYRDETRWAFEAVTKIIDEALKASGNLAATALLPAPGVAQEPFEEWHRRECPLVSDPTTRARIGNLEGGPCHEPDERWRRESAILPTRFLGKSCREVYESEKKVPGAPRGPAGFETQRSEEGGRLASASLPEGDGLPAPTGTDAPAPPAMREALELVSDFPGHTTESAWNLWLFRRDEFLKKHGGGGRG